MGTILVIQSASYGARKSPSALCNDVSNDIISVVRNAEVERRQRCRLRGASLCVVISSRHEIEAPMKLVRKVQSRLWTCSLGEVQVVPSERAARQGGKEGFVGSFF